VIRIGHLSSDDNKGWGIAGRFEFTLKLQIDLETSFAFFAMNTWRWYEVQ